MWVMAAFAPCRACSSSFVSASEALVDCQLSGYQVGSYLKAPVRAPSSVSSLPTDCYNLLLCLRRANAATSGTSLSFWRRRGGLGGTNHGRGKRNLRCSSQRVWAELVDDNQTTTLKEVVELEGSQGNQGKWKPAISMCRCQMCGRRGLFAALFGGFSASKAAGASDVQINEYNKIIETVHPCRGAWYEEYFARVMESGMDSYEAEIADYKRELFDKLDDCVEEVLELGVGTGPNLKYYGNRPHVQKVIGIDPNLSMAQFCSAAAVKAGLSQSQFEFIHGVGEIIPLPDASVDAVVCTLVLCSVTNVSSTLKEVKRVLKPGGSFLFVEHVAAPEGQIVRLWQKILDPLQQLFADGCHLTRDTRQDIELAQFETVDAKRFTLPALFVIGPHIAGVAHTAHKDL